MQKWTSRNEQASTSAVVRAPASVSQAPTAVSCTGSVHAFQHGYQRRKPFKIPLRGSFLRLTFGFFNTDLVASKQLFFSAFRDRHFLLVPRLEVFGCLILIFSRHVHHVFAKFSAICRISHAEAECWLREMFLPATRAILYLVR